MSDVFQIVTDRIVAQLEQGVIPWHRPWINILSGAYSKVTGKPYSLLNQMLLPSDGAYASYQGWKKLGGQVKQGSKGSIIVFWKTPEKPDDEKAETDEEAAKKQRPVLRYYKVFHESQVDGIEPSAPAPVLFETHPIEAAEELFRGYVEREGIKVELELCNEAFYSPDRDLIHAPDIGQYAESESYYSTIFHEAVHSTGTLSRLNRPGLNHVSFGSETYSKEELIAEMGSAFILHYLGMGTSDDTLLANSAAYIQGWLRALQDDRKLIVFAASQAEKAANYIINQRTSV